MKRLAAGWLASVVSALAVALSLVFVGFEIRQNTVAQRSATIEGVFSQRTDFNIATVADDSMIDVIRRVNEGATSADLTANQVQKGRMWIITFLRILESAQRQAGLGVLDSQEVLNTFESLRPIATWPFFQEQWEGTDQWPTLRRNFAVDFIEYFEAEFVE